jgi:Trk-type K+ transport system membrane component
MSDLERLLQGALVPIEPPTDLSLRLERRLSAVTEAAVDELAEWDPSALRDPRRWARFVVAGVVGASAGGALVLVRARQNQKHRDARGLAALQKGVRSVVSDARKRLDR